uniref:Pectinesterase inhibitor domain-containing protein n=1 Tax=Ditylum brightwellii TaxID=49249 RepID=A0A7S4QHV9_9STRA|mmetsp:Transcript_8747/g.11617  ORF Transcript_8747/g.11617 Transcript_8747/m.11617 type:complete len:244 (-) Transcript_8747:434-1165(-)
MWTTNLLFSTFTILFHHVTSTTAFTTIHPHSFPTTSTTTKLYSLKPAAIPLMDSGKALARSGEILIDYTSTLNLYGGGLSAAGANIRNCGDAVAQAAASCRFKTGAELVCDELRNGGDSLKEAVDKLKLAVEECMVEERTVYLAPLVESTVNPMESSSIALEAAGASIQQRRPIADVGEELYKCACSLEQLAMAIQQFDVDAKEPKECSTRMMFASTKMKEAGDELRGKKDKPKPKGKSWIKG